MNTNIRLIISILILLIICLFQVTVMPQLAIFGAIGNIILITVVIFQLFGFFEQGLLWASLGGIFLDTLSSSSIGNFTIGLLVIYFGLYFLRQKILGVPPLFLVLVFGFASSLIFDFIYLVFTYLRDVNYFSVSYFQLMLYNALINTFLTAVIYLAVGWFKERYLAKKEIKI